MKCSKCGAELSAGALFCTQCGTRVGSDKQAKLLRCRVCGGTLTVDADRQVMVCPFCQSAELIVESDAVAIERIKTDAYRDIEMERLRQEEACEQRRIEQEQSEEKKKSAYTGKFGKWAILCLVLAVFCIARTVSLFRDTPIDILAGVLSAVQAILFIAAWLLGRKNSYGKTQWKHKLLVLAAFAIFWVYVLANTGIEIDAISIPDYVVEIPSITQESITDPNEGIFCYPVRDYTGRNAASIGKTTWKYRIDDYGDAELRIVFVTENGIFVDPQNEEQLQGYIVYAQSIAPNTNLIAVTDRYSDGDPSSTIDYQSHEEIVLYVRPIADPNPSAPSITAINMSTDRRTYFLRNYVGRNAASIGTTSSSKRVDIYGHGEVRIVFTTVDGTYLDTTSIAMLRQYVVISQSVAPNSTLTYTYSTYSDGEETNTVKYQNYTEINLTVQRLDESVIAQMPEITPTPVPEPTPVQIKLQLEYEVRNGKTVITGYSGNGNYLYIPSSLGGHEVVAIADGAFKNCTTLESITCYADIVTIGDSAFEGCTALTEISLPHEIEEIGDYAFRNCTSLASVIIWGDPNFGAYSFAGCTSLDSISISHDTKTVGAHAFEGCTALTEVIFWGGEVIEEYAFAGCTSLDSVSLPHDMKRVKAHAFDGCTALTSLIVWDDETVIDRLAFANCPNLNSEYAGPVTMTTPTTVPTDTPQPTIMPTTAPTATPTPTPVPTNTPTATPRPTATPTAAPTARPTPTPTPYSSKYEIALIRELNGYTLYYLIDMDGKVARYYGTNDTSVQVGKVSGNLTSGLRITYSYWGDTWTETLKYSNSSHTRVTLTDANGFTWTYTVTDLESAEAVLNRPGYHDMR